MFLQLVVRAVRGGDLQVERDVRRIGQYGPGEDIGGAAELASRVFTTVYMGTVNSSTDTCRR